MSGHKNWQNRIIGEGEESPDQLLANPMNFRIHPKFQQDALSGVLNEIGWIQRVIVNQTTGHVIDGHLRAQLAISRGETSIPVLYVSLTEQEEKLALATIDPISAMAATDKAQLDALLKQVTSGDAAVMQMLSELAADNGIVDLPDDSLPTDNDYSRKVEVPLYEPTGHKPTFPEMVDLIRYNQLVTDIDNDPLLNDVDRQLLKLGAARHIVFNYASIADYYAESPPAAQRHIENSALVIVDFDRALELGYIKLSKAIADIVADEEDNGD